MILIVQVYFKVSQVTLLTKHNLTQCLFTSDIADKVVNGTAKFEELGVASHDIAANTAQLVAASRVKARPESDKLKSLKESSRAGSVILSLLYSSFHAYWCHSE